MVLVDFCKSFLYELSIAKVVLGFLTGDTDILVVLLMVLLYSSFLIFGDLVISSQIDLK
jgi:hypothetical protein